MKNSLTGGVHHVGLTTSKLEETASFFVDTLQWTEVKRNNDYPAIFVTDGTIILTLWAAKSSNITEFDRTANICLHHLALMVKSDKALAQIYQRLTSVGASIEFSPELLKNGPAKHMMCYEPSGIRIEFIWPAA